ncbi:flavin-containing monooxygenase [Herbihabitans rhizosphaerae]
MALELKRNGYHDFTVLEKAGEVGGVWRENTYPGAGCDIPSPYYSFSYEPNPVWPMRFSLREDITAYMNGVVDRHGLREHIRFRTEVASAEFDKDSGQWTITTSTGETLTADVFVPATGQLSRPSHPDIPGRETFAGKAFHSAEWDHDVDLTGKRVAVIGTGASAIQFVPKIQQGVDRLTLFQRSAPYIAPKPDTVYKPLHHTAFARFPVLQKAERFLWWAFCEFSTMGIVGNKAIAKLGSAVTRWHLKRQVFDPALRAKLTPDYPIGCKRVLFADDYYPALAQSNVDVVTERIAEITPGGVRDAAGTQHDVDVIVYGTGFATQSFLAPIAVRGLDGRDLNDAWADGARAYLGITVPAFPNLFLMYGPNTNLGAGSIIYMLERQARYIRQLVDHLDGQSYVDVRVDVEARYDREIQSRLAGTAWASCASWYRTEAGRVTNNWPGLVSEYDRRTRTVNLADYRTVTVPRESSARPRAERPGSPR